MTFAGYLATIPKSMKNIEHSLKIVPGSGLEEMNLEMTSKFRFHFGVISNVGGGMVLRPPLPTESEAWSQYRDLERNQDLGMYSVGSFEIGERYMVLEEKKDKQGKGFYVHGKPTNHIENHGGIDYYGDGLM